MYHERKCAVVDYCHLLRPSIHYAEVLREEPLLGGAVVSVQSVLEVPLVRVKVIEYDIGVGGGRGRKYDDFSEGGEFLDEFEAEGPHSDSSLYHSGCT